MKTRLWKIVRGTVFVWGCFSLLAALTLGGFVAYKLGPGNHTRKDRASVRDVRFVLNWCGLGEERIESVPHSHVSFRSIGGDYVDVYAIKISHLDLAELRSGKDPWVCWYRGDLLPDVLARTVVFVASWRSEVPWLPSEEELRSSAFYVYAREIELDDLEPSAARLIFVRPSDKMVFYIGCKT